MSNNTGKVAFVILAVIFFFGFMKLILGGVMDMVALASFPVILSAEAIVFGMLYATIFHSETEGTAAAHSVASIAEPSKPASQRKIQQAHLFSPSRMVKS